MRPVNIPFDECIWPEQFDFRVNQRRQRHVAAAEQPDARWTERSRRDVQLDVIHDAFVPCRSMENRTAFEQQALDVEGG